MTSMVTLRADPCTLFATMLDSRCPKEGSYTFDRDSTHFRYILYYFRNGAHLEAVMLPHEKKYVLELLVEARFY